MNIETLILIINSVSLLILILIAVTLYLSVKNRTTTGSNLILNQLNSVKNELCQEIRYAVSPKFIDLSTGVSDLVDLAVEVWRTEQKINKISTLITENQRSSIDTSVQKLKKYLEKYDVTTIDYTNQKFNEGLNLDILSVETDDTVTDPIIKETVEPTIMLKGQVVRKAKIILLKGA